MAPLFMLGVGIASVGGIFVWLARKIISSPERRWWRIVLAVLLSLFGLACFIFAGVLVYTSFVIPLD
ncbi:MAG: hypothetical protein K8R23_16985 [Chthoniobacter sp.]|nr:hypothetical protein [Chthoniobacter sp.]